MFNVSQKKKGYRLARLGEQPLYENIKEWRGNVFFTQKLFPLTSKTPKLTGTTRTTAPKLHC